MDRLLPYVPDIRNATHFDIGNVATYYWKYKAEDDWKTRQFSVAPPFDFFTMAYQFPTNYDPAMRGVEVMTVFRRTDRAPANSIHVISEDGDCNSHPPIIPPDTAWLVNMDIFSFDKRQLLAHTQWFFAADSYGLLCRHEGELALWFTDSDKGAPITTFANTIFQIPFLALTFLHCRNVTVIKPNAPGHRRLPRKKKFETRYHRIRIDAIGGAAKRYESAGSGKKSGIRQALHIVRGHFRHYGPASQTGHPDGVDTKPLFGKYIGKYWVPAQTRGNLSAGAVTADYEIS